ncbi:MAG: PSP1 domain-containing protein [Culicoidibacterales bacterium]
MIEVVGIRFKPVGKIYFFSPKDEQFTLDTPVIVETARGLELGFVVIANRVVTENDVVLPLRAVLRKASVKDVQQSIKNQTDAKAAVPICQKLVEKNKLEMNLLEAEYTFERERLIFFFTAEGRVDFRELVKDLAAQFRTRIELRQVGVRDEAKIIGGLGPCGYALCCSTFLSDFDTVTIRMAKNQNFSLNPTKISGACGRLLCCLKYENDLYEETLKKLPDVGSIVQTPDGDGRVVGLNILNELVQVDIFQRRNEGNRVQTFNFDELAIVKPVRRAKKDDRELTRELRSVLD